MLSSLFAVSFIPLAAQEMPRAFAPRALRFTDGAGHPIVGSCRDARWNARGNGVFFTLEANGTRNIWRAFPDLTDSNHFPSWRAAPVTKFKAPQGAARPVPLPGDRDLVCLRLSSGNSTQLAILNIATNNYTLLARDVKAIDDPAPSPDGASIAFTGVRDKQTSVFVTTGAPGDTARLVAASARRPVWLDNRTLQYESLNPQARGLYRVSLAPKTAPEVVMVGGGEAGALPGGIGTVFSARTSASEPTRLYLIARDGSGLRVLKGTEGARRPATSRDGTLIYDAPLEENGPRALWVLRLDMGRAPLPNPLASPRVLQAQSGQGTQVIARPPAVGRPPVTARAFVAPRPATGKRSAARPLVANRPRPVPRPAGRPVDKADSLVFSKGEPVFPPMASTSFVPPLPPLSAAPPIPSPSGIPVGRGGPLGTSRDNYSPVTALGSLSPGFGSSIFSTPALVPPIEAAPLPTPSPLVPSQIIPLAGTKGDNAGSSTGGNANPVGQLLGVRRAVLSSGRLDAPASNGSSPEVLAITGTVSGADVQATLEVGAGESPSRWTAIPVISASVSQAPFAFWTPPRGAQGVWMLRLTVTNSRGAAQSLLRVKLPLPRPTVVINPVDSLPLPPPAPSPSQRPTPTPTPELRPAPRPVPFEPLPPAPVQIPVPFKPPSPIKTPAPAPRPRPTQAPLPPAMPTPPPPPASFVGTFNISGTLATMTPGQKARVTFWGINRGNTPWQTGAMGTGRVRLVARWVDFSTGTRRKWNVVWLKTPVAPNSRTNWEFDLEAPTRPGKYKLIYGLVRWPDDNNFEPPPYNAPQAAWMGEFSAIAFAIDVVPPSAP